MKMRSLRKTVWMVLSFVTGMVCAQDYQKTANGIKSETCDMRVELRFYSPTQVRVLKYPKTETVDKLSFSVVKSPEKTPFTVAEEDKTITLKSESLAVSLDVETGKVSFKDIQGRPLLAEKDYGTHFTPVKYEENETYAVWQAFLLDKDEALYGLGQHQQGKMNQRNQRIVLRQKNKEIAIPYIQSTKGYGLFWDNCSATTFTDNPMETSFDSEAGDCADYYFLYGGTPDNVLRSMRDLTGGVQMNALWTYGFWQSRERYQSQEELLEVVGKYRELKVPLDGIIQDWQYWGRGAAVWNAVEFNNPLFPNPKQMIDDVHRMNARIAISVWPSFGEKTRIYDEFKQKKMLLDLIVWPKTTCLYDPFNPEARDLYWRYMEKNLLSLGIDGWWLDATEPEMIGGNIEELDQMTHAGPFRNVANAFPLMTVGGVYDHQRKTLSDKRVYIFTRSAFAGQQRYGANSWSGDIVSSWEVLHNQISAGLNFSICGIPYWNEDIGGFFSGVNYPDGVKDPAYRELYARWIQFGAFTPMMRSHGTNTPREIYQFGERGSWEFDTIEKYIHLRYKMLPYIYSTAWNVTKHGDTFMRPLFMDFPQDAAARDLNSQFMFGRSLLIVPVTEPMYVDANKQVNLNEVKSKEVYLPQGCDWFDFWTGNRFQGGQTMKKETPIDIMPVYVKAGTILPIGPKVQYAEEKKWDNLEIRVYPGADGKYVLYEDENDNYNYEKGAYSEITFTWDDAKRTLTISDRKGNFDGMLQARRFNIILVNAKKGLGDREAVRFDKKVSYNGKELRVKL